MFAQTRKLCGFVQFKASLSRPSSKCQGVVNGVVSVQVIKADVLPFQLAAVLVEGLNKAGPSRCKAQDSLCT